MSGEATGRQQVIQEGCSRAGSTGEQRAGTDMPGRPWTALRFVPVAWVAIGGDGASMRPFRAGDAPQKAGREVMIAIERGAELGETADVAAREGGGE